jgi:hypothetical protein
MRNNLAFLLLALPLYACGGDDTANPVDASTDGSKSDVAVVDAPSDTGSDAAPACTANGGSCVAVSACSPDKGLLGVGTCSGASLTCCLPLTACPPENFACCNATTSFRPTCVGGALECPAGFTQCTSDGGADGGGDAGTDAPADAPTDG